MKHRTLDQILDAARAQSAYDALMQCDPALNPYVAAVVREVPELIERIRFLERAGINDRAHLTRVADIEHEKHMAALAEVERQAAQLAEWRAQYDAIDADNERLRAEVARLTPRKVDTVEDLDALPYGAVILDRDTAVLQKDSDGLWLEPGASDLTPVLPALVLWTGGVS